MDSVQNCDSHINAPLSETYTSDFSSLLFASVSPDDISMN
jgi:hypothetical protein